MFSFLGTLMGNGLKRDQHPAFGGELRGLKRPGTREALDLYRFVVVAVEAVSEVKCALRLWPGEERMAGTIRDVSKAAFNGYGYSVRLYWAIHKGTMWMLALDANKRRTKVTDGMIRALEERLRWVREK